MQTKIKNVPYSRFFQRTSKMQTSSDFKSGKIVAIIALAVGALFGWLPAFGGIFKMAAWILMIFAVMSIAKASRSPTLFKSYIFTCLSAIAVAFFNFFVLAAPILITLIILVFTVGFIYFGYKYYKEMRDISGVAFFFYAFICMAVSFALSLLWLGAIGWIFNVVAFILELVAWITLSKVKVYGADYVSAEPTPVIENKPAEPEKPADDSANKTA